MYGNRDFAFTNEVKRWLKKVEEIYNLSALPGVTEFSTARLQIMGSERGVLNGGSIRRYSRKHIASVTIESITRAANSLQSLTSTLDEEFSYSKTSIRKLLLDALSSGNLKRTLKDYTDAMEMWQKLLSDQKTSALSVEVLEKNSYLDAALLMLEVFHELENEQRGIVNNSHADKNNNSFIQKN